MPLKIIGNNLDCSKTLRNELPAAEEGKGAGVYWKEGNEEKRFQIPKSFSKGKVKIVAAAIYSLIKYEDQNAAAYLKHIVDMEEKAGVSMIGVEVDQYSEDIEKKRQALSILTSHLVNWTKLPFVFFSNSRTVLSGGARTALREKHPHVLFCYSVNSKEILDLAMETDAAIVLSLRDAQLSSNPEERVEAMKTLFLEVTSNGLPLNRIMMDPRVLPVSVDSRQGMAFLDACKKLRYEYGEQIPICANISDISQGLPGAPLLNLRFLKMAEQAGLDCPIIDPFCIRPAGVYKQKLWDAAENVITGRDEFAMEFINIIRQQ